jgi:hypothetical protein
MRNNTPKGTGFRQPQGQREVRCHVWPNYWTLFLPREQHHVCSLPDMLQNSVLPQIAAEADGLIFQQDGASAHFGATVRTSLDERLPGRWIARWGSFKWPSRIPDLTLMELFWGYIKDIVHSERVEFLSELHLGTDRTENTSSRSPPLVAWRHHGRDVFLCCVCTSHYLATELYAAILWDLAGKHGNEMTHFSFQNIYRIWLSSPASSEVMF